MSDKKKKKVNEKLSFLTENKNKEYNVIIKRITNDKKEVKEFEPFKHFFKIEIDATDSSYDDIATLSVEIPDGYEIFVATPLQNNEGLYAYDFWYTNNKKVKVEPTFNEFTGKYDYITFGEVIEEEKKLKK